jgi:pimeloyl-ACP methyl ester carboxylesterase
VHHITFSGWGQAPDHLSNCFSIPTAIDCAYMDYPSQKEALASLPLDTEYDLAIGWSLGGQVLLSALCAGRIKPRKIILIATPFSFVQTPLWRNFRTRFTKDPTRMLAYYNRLLVSQDQQPVPPPAPYHTPYLDTWLDALEAFQGQNILPHTMPPCLILHGDRDAIIPVEQGKLWAKHLANTTVSVLQGAAHAPHLSNPSVQERVLSF